jgi:hypothetical protein
MGGKKKSSRKPVARRAPKPLDRIFPCPFCNNEGVVTCKLCVPAAHRTPRGADGHARVGLGGL